MEFLHRFFLRRLRAEITVVGEVRVSKSKDRGLNSADRRLLERFSSSWTLLGVPEHQVCHELNRFSRRLTEDFRKIGRYALGKTKVHVRRESVSFWPCRSIRSSKNRAD